MIEIVRPSPNHKERRSNIDAIIIHTTGGAREGALSWLCNPTSGVSCHVLIDTDGNVYRLVDDRNQAYHAGISMLHGRQYCNGFSLGVELERTPDAIGGYPFMQLQSAAEWCAAKAMQYQIPLNRIVGHADIAPGRKVDPENFPWLDWLLEVAARFGA